MHGTAAIDFKGIFEESLIDGGKMTAIRGRNAARPG
jgi:hypothetical protein